MKRKSEKDVRASASRLKRLGLLPHDTPIKNVRRGQKAYRKLELAVDKYDDVLSNKQTVLQNVPKSKLKMMRQLGHETARGKVLVSVSKQETARFNPKSGEVIIHHKSTGQRRIILPVDNWQNWLKAVENLPELPEGHNYAFKFYGSKGIEHFDRGTAHMKRYLRRYRTPQYNPSIKRDEWKRHGDEIIQHIEIFDMSHAKLLDWEKQRVKK